ncbi:hypothetical protein L1049_014239 [Liquidambar formosana]|uniref:Uncharacterized protein n=1 Tax=Liquidambar formosana TaxID=63359 RepID=A0AAP0RRS3_LIQFO
MKGGRKKRKGSSPAICWPPSAPDTKAIPTSDLQSIHAVELGSIMAKLGVVRGGRRRSALGKWYYASMVSQQIYLLSSLNGLGSTRENHWP